MFQLHYAIALVGLGFVTGAFMRRSLLLKCSLALLSFTATFGIGWGAVTLIELALGFAIGNSIFGRAKQSAPGSDIASSPPVNASVPQALKTARPLLENVVPKIGKVIVCNHCKHRKVIDHSVMTKFLQRNPITSGQPYDPSINADKLRCTACNMLGARIV